MGAKLVANTNDILEDLNLKLATQQQEARQIIPDSEEEKLILETLAAESIHIDKIIAATKLDTAVVGSTLSLMEIKGKVKNLGGMTYVIAR
jgi:DNA processing protein